MARHGRRKVGEGEEGIPGRKAPPMHDARREDTQGCAAMPYTTTSTRSLSTVRRGPRKPFFYF